MPKPKITIVNAETGEVIERELNDVELAQWQKDKADAEAKKQMEADKALAREALLQRLGITSQEAQLLLN